MTADTNFRRSWKDDMGVGDALLFLLLEDKYVNTTFWTELALANIESTFKQPQDNIDLGYLNVQLLKLQNELDVLDNDMEHIKKYLENDHLKAIDYIAKNGQRKLRESLSTLRSYLASPNNSVLLQDEFFKEAATLPPTLNTLIDSLLDDENLLNSSKPNLMIALQNAFDVSVYY